MQHLRRNLPPSRIQISVEIERPGRAGLRELAAEADVVFYSRSWAEVSCFVLPRWFANQSDVNLTGVPGGRLLKRRSLSERRGYELSQGVSCLSGLGTSRCCKTSHPNPAVMSPRPLLLCTWGADGAFALSSPSRECIHAPAPAASKVVEYVRGKAPQPSSHVRLWREFRKARAGVSMLTGIFLVVRSEQVTPSWEVCYMV